MAGKRPSWEVFEHLCSTMTQREIAEMYGVTVQSVSQWSKHYDVYPRPAKRGRKPGWRQQITTRIGRPSTEQEALRKQLAEDVKAFKAAGGKIQRVPMGATGDEARLR